ncbi:hypothetical protein GGI26_004467 [Coemansia sp. RSA 1358]|nr:hypothetical protein GGI26_004467 [Coemansia sp. RSA 1358]
MGNIDVRIPEHQRSTSFKQPTCDSGGFCYYKRNIKSHIIWSTMLGSLFIIIVASIMFRRWKQRRATKIIVYNMLEVSRLSEPLPRYSPAYDCAHITQEDIARMCHISAIKAPKAALLKPHSCSPPPYGNNPV